MKLNFKVADMSCGHCKMTIQAALQELEGVETVSINLEEKDVIVETDLDPEIIMSKIRERGYHPLLSGSSSPG